MYYHPFILPTFIADDRVLNTYRAITGVWLDSIERHHAVQLDAAKDFCSARLENARRLSEARDGAQFAMRAFSAAASEPFKMIAVASKLSGIAIDSHRQAMELLESHNEEPANRPTFADVHSEALQVRDKPGASRRKRQMMG